MLALYILLSIVTILATIYGIYKFCGYTESRYGYHVFDKINVITLCVTGIVSAALFWMSSNNLYHGPARLTTDLWNPLTILLVWALFNIVVFIGVFIRNTVNTSLICAVPETILQYIAATTIIIAAILALYAIDTFLNSIRRNTNVLER